MWVELMRCTHSMELKISRSAYKSCVSERTFCYSGMPQRLEDNIMFDSRSFRKEMNAELELEEALQDKSLSTKERAVIEEQLRIIRKKYDDMVAELYA